MTTAAPVQGERLDLPGVTLVAVTSVAVPATIRALILSLQRCRFGSALFLSNQPPPEDLVSRGNATELEWRPIPPIRSRAEYSQFMIAQLPTYVETGHALCVQWDGYVLRPQSWRAEFLDYDYIGAPWPHFDDDMLVGNGGFSLRSQRLMRAAATLSLAPGEVEDVAICRTHRRWLEQQHGIRFAPPELAEHFAVERLAARGNEFGFHGVFNLAEIIGRAEFKALLHTLEPQIMAPSERRELLCWALARLDLGLACMIARRILLNR